MYKNIWPVLFILALSFQNCSRAQPENPVSVSEKSAYKLELIVNEVEIPWSISQLPDGALLYSEKAGQLIHFKDGTKTIIHEFENVFTNGQAGLFDVVLDPDYKNNGWIYLAIATSSDGGETGNTEIFRSKLKGNQLADLESLYKGGPDTDKPYHFGGRIAFDKSGYLYFSIGDRGNRDENPQDITRDGGKIYRINKDGSIPSDNPFYNSPGAKKAIYSYGHRNPQGLIYNPAVDQIWDSEHGPRGGDEMNVIKAGENNGWPVISYGINYNGTKFTDITKKEGMQDPLLYWVPSIAPCGMDYVTSDYYPEWKGDILIGSLKFMYLNRCDMEGSKVVGQERLFDKKGRVRDVYQAPDGFLYVSIEHEGIFKIVK